MQKQFVTYEIAKKLKELGFDEECFGYYSYSKKLFLGNGKDAYNYKDIISAPLWQQAIDWIAEKYKIEIATTSWKKEGTKDEIIWVYSIEPLGKPCLYGFKKIFPSKVEALKFAIEEALKLI